MTKRLLLVSGFCFASLARTTAAYAQSDTNPAMPNVLLLVDTSGSMEFKSSSAGCPSNEACLPSCTPDQPNNGTINPNEKSRWTDLLEVMTGSIQNYSCFTEQRVGTAFSDEFRLGTSVPYDLGYQYPYNRPLSNECAPGPGTAPLVSSPYAYPSNAIAYRSYNAGSQSIILNSSCAFGQWRDGLLDAYDGLVRFGLMTFDTHQDPSTGISAAGTADYAGGFLGTWSYYITGGAFCKNVGPNGECMGAPWNCGTLYPYEVGARNAAAPPWEGRMVAFGPPPEDGRQRNQWIQEILLATRPYGATPIAGMLADARNFLWFDNTSDPLNSGQDFGPMNDATIDSTPIPPPDPNDPNPPAPTIDTGNCRQEYIILLTDGEPNIDLRPDASGSGCVNPNNGNDSSCPYETSAKIVKDLANPANPAKTVRTFVVGFALGKLKEFTPDGGSTTINCETMDIATQCSPMPTDRALKACCTLNEIAWNGTPQSLQANPNEITHAFFPSSAAELKQALDKILRNISTKITGRTFPVTTPAPLGETSFTGVGYEFDTGVNVPAGWKGVLTRKRFQCVNNVATPQTPSTTLGDDFVATLNKYPLERTLFTFIGDDKSGIRYPQSSMRPWYTATVNDGVGTYGGVQTQYVAPDGLAAEVPPEAMSVSDSTCDTSSENLSKNQCRDRLLNWASGVPNAGNLPARCRVPDTSSCNVIGDIFHSQPQVRTKPSDLLPDDTYAAFATALAKRDTLLYVSSNDGFLHSFLISPGDLVANANEIVNKQFPHQERWAFIPPAILPSFFSMYPGSTTVPGVPPPTTMTRMPVLDGTPIIKDVGATLFGTDTGEINKYPYRLERRRFASSAAQETQTWRTILIEGFGPLRSGYFALDITKPTIVTGDGTSGPRFLWQLTTDDATTPHNLFGKTSPNPLITTLFFNTGDSSDPLREVAVAVLSGGDGDAATGTDCDVGPTVTEAAGSPKITRKVRCYNSDVSFAARSLTIVRLDTGAVVQTFRPKVPSGLTPPVVNFATDTVQYIDISSPISGQPVAYPAQTGQIADRIFVGDRDGRVWRVDVSDTDPKKWTMQVFFDAYYGQASDVGQPVQNQPIVSVDQQGQLTMAFTTGDQDNLTPDLNMKNYVVSTVEVLDRGAGINTFQSKLQWQKEFDKGERVVGPLTLFDKVLYFSSVFPAAGVDCHQGYKSNIWAFDYLENTGGSPPGPKTDLLDARAQAGAIQKSDIRDIPSLVAGVGLRQLPSCSTIATGVASSDAFLGYGTMTTIGATAPGGFQLVYQKNAGSQTGITTGPPIPPVQTIELAPPNNLVQVDSWAPIIE